MRPDDTGLLVVDLQERILAAQPAPERLVWNVRRLIEGAQVLGLRTAATEQSPEKLGPTAASLTRQLGIARHDAPEPAPHEGETVDPGPRAYRKEAFSCGECGDLFRNWRELGIGRVLVCGIETHVCVQQTVLDLLADGYQVQVAVDAVSARYAINHEIGLRRLELSGGLLTTVEAALFELCERAGTAQFKKISAIVKESGE
jgi:nicotinamidase-related amidase